MVEKQQQKVCAFENFVLGQKKSFVSSPTTTRFLENLETFFYFYFFFIFLFFLKSCTFWIILAREIFFSSRDEKNFACGAHFFLVVMTNIGFWYLIVSIVSKSYTFKGTDKMWRNHHTSLVVYSPFGSIW